MKQLFILFGAISLAAGLNVVTLRYCCGLGTKHANSSLDCSNFQTPITGVRKDDESACLHHVEVCCKNQNQELECGRGIQSAKTGETCEGQGFKKDCCDACQMGQDTAKSQNSCQENLGLGLPLDKAFTDCCNDVINSASTTSTTTQQPSSTELAKSTAAENYSPLPPLENVCDIGDVCAQICIPTEDSYKCGCNKGWTLMSDGISCKPEKRALRKGDRCSKHNPCDHDCIDTGLEIKCSCREGYELQDDKRTCKDIDECARGVHDCKPTEECINDEGSYMCDDPNFQPETDLGSDPLDVKCPVGYKFNYEKLVCDDIDECEFDIICARPKVCINTIGSFQCEGEDTPQCPPGFHFKDSIQTCADIDECITGENDCNKESQVCLNTKGNYTCIDKVSKKTCPPGFKKNPFTQNCDDIDECFENDNPCGENEECVNEPGGHNCVPKTGKPYEYPLRPPYEPELPPKPDLEETTPKSTTTSTTTTPKPLQATCPGGFRYSTRTNSCVDIDECQEDDQLCDSNQDCYNSPGSYLCNCKTGFTKDYQTGACVDINECQVGSHDCTEAQRCDNTIGSYLCPRMTGCGTGYTLNYANGLCEDDDECSLGTHNCRSLGVDYKCRNTLGSYRCEAVRQVRPQIRPPQIIQQRPQIVPSVATPQIVPNIGRPQVVPSVATPQIVPNIGRPSVGIPQGPSVGTSQKPHFLPKPYSTQNYPIISGTRKKCLPGYIMNERGNCEDINECASNPCRRGQKCLNFNGRYQCISEVHCKIGYELDEAGESCLDINECERGTHSCTPTQICKNGQGYYTCECPPGHHLNPTSERCEDINECKYYGVCTMNSECVNTIGSYKCQCKDGFRKQDKQGNFCEDIDECKDDANLCEHTCVNIWGTYRCACKPGFLLNHDNRTCTDIDECEKFKHLKICVGGCENIPGSYTCKCPKGYYLSDDKRACIDIDECQKNICGRPDDICLNTRGSYKCYAIKCPPNYFRDPQHKGRCKRPESLCDPREMQCILMPEQYTYHYITLTSDLPIPKEGAQFFQILGPKWSISRAEFSMKVVNVVAPYNVERVHERFFKMLKPQFNNMQLSLVRPITGPQEIELKVEMKLYRGATLASSVVAHIFIVVSEYSF